MMRNKYPHTSDPAILEAQRGAAMAKSIAAVSVICGIFAVVALSMRSVQRPDSPPAGISLVAPATSGEVHSKVSGPPPVASERLDEPVRLDPKEIDDYKLNVHG